MKGSKPVSIQAQKMLYLLRNNLNISIFVVVRHTILKKDNKLYQLGDKDK